jgi:hypothetical protein
MMACIDASFVIPGANRLVVITIAFQGDEGERSPALA